LSGLSDNEMIDLHTHTLLSDGEFVPEELVRRCEVLGYRYLVIADHVGISTVETVVAQLIRLCGSLGGVCYPQVKVGAELTHVRPDLIGKAVKLTRKAGAQIVVGHGESIAEPVAPGTNRAFIEAGVDVLAHPGLITEAEARLAARRGVGLEISARRGHSFTNGHVLQMARKAGAMLVFGSDGHAPGDYPDRAMAERIAYGAGMTNEEVRELFENSKRVFLRRSRKEKRP
jgi:putative hydrolase